MNIGEKDELKAKLSLINWKIHNRNGIESVGFYSNNGYKEYLEHDLNINTIKNLNQKELEEKCSQCGIVKAPSSAKADVIINGINTSLKSMNGALPALLNHTHRAGIKAVCTGINLDIKPLDDAVDKYWKLRQAGSIGEVIKMSLKGNPFASIKGDLIKLLGYFLFEGTARGDSKVQAVQVYSLTDPTDFTTWSKYDKNNGAKMYINNITLSIRSKGISDKYDPKATDEVSKSITKWTRYTEGKYRGSLHIRG